MLILLVFPGPAHNLSALRSVTKVTSET